jgi:hypothetical protein
LLNLQGKFNEPYTPHINKLVLKSDDMCNMIVDWHDEENEIELGDSNLCAYSIGYGDNSLAKGLLVEDNIKYKTLFEKETNHLFKAYFGYIYK